MPWPQYSALSEFTPAQVSGIPVHQCRMGESTHWVRADPTPPESNAWLHLQSLWIFSSVQQWKYVQQPNPEKNTHAWISLLKFTVPQNPIKQPKSIKLFMYSRLRTARSNIYFGLVPVTVTILLSVLHFSAIQLKVKLKPSYSQWALKDETFIGL